MQAVPHHRAVSTSNINIPNMHQANNNGQKGGKGGKQVLFSCPGRPAKKKLTWKEQEVIKKAARQAEEEKARVEEEAAARKWMEEEVARTAAMKAEYDKQIKAIPARPCPPCPPSFAVLRLWCLSFSCCVRTVRGRTSGALIWSWPRTPVTPQP